MAKINWGVEFSTTRRKTLTHLFPVRPSQGALPLSAKAFKPPFHPVHPKNGEATTFSFIYMFHSNTAKDPVASQYFLFRESGLAVSCRTLVLCKALAPGTVCEQLRSVASQYGSMTLFFV